MSNKLCEVTHYYPSQVQASSDSEIIRGIQNSTSWMISGWGIHRYYLRLLKQEARRRGLTY